MEAAFAESGESEPTWREVLALEKEEQYFRDLLSFVDQERQAGKIIYPKNSEIFNALAYAPFQNVKVVILGQDPYHGPNQAHGLCFSVRKGVPLPPSLLNIFKELESDLGIPRPAHGCLESWAKQGVLLLNAVLSVESGKAGSHADLGWERFTDKVISELSERKSVLVFMLWGAYAQKKGAVIDGRKHLVLKAPHPSPFSADKGFFGCKHFSKANEALQAQGLSPINWALEA